MLKQYSSESTLTLVEDNLWKLIKIEPLRFGGRGQKGEQRCGKIETETPKQIQYDSKFDNFLKKIHDSVNQSLSLCSDSVSEVVEDLQFSFYDHQNLGIEISVSVLDTSLDASVNSRDLYQQQKGEISRLEFQLKIKSDQNHNLSQQNARLSQENIDLNTKIKTLKNQNKTILNELEQLYGQLRHQTFIIEETVSMKYEQQLTNIYSSINQTLANCSSCSSIISHNKNQCPSVNPQFLSINCLENHSEWESMSNHQNYGCGSQLRKGSEELIKCQQQQSEKLIRCKRVITRSNKRLKRSKKNLSMGQFGIATVTKP